MNPCGELFMRITLLIFLLIFASCGVKKNEPHYGKTTKEELTLLLGEPSRVEEIPVENSNILHYANGDKYQIKNNIVSNAFMVPKTEEATLVYWQHALKHCDVKIEVLKKELIGHELPEKIMKCDTEGVGVIFNENSSHVLRVYKYEKN